jgi:hypothetical protein
MQQQGLSAGCCQHHAWPPLLDAVVACRMGLTSLQLTLHQLGAGASLSSASLHGCSKPLQLQDGCTWSRGTVLRMRGMTCRHRTLARMAAARELWTSILAWVSEQGLHHLFPLSSRLEVFNWLQADSLKLCFQLSCHDVLAPAEAEL